MFSILGGTSTSLYLQCQNCNSNIIFLSFIVLKLIGLLCWSIKLSLEFRVTVHNTESKPLEGKCFWLYFSVCILSSYSFAIQFWCKSIVNQKIVLVLPILIHYLQYLKQHFHLHLSEVLVITLINPEEPLFFPNYFMPLLSIRGYFQSFYLSITAS